MDQNSFFEAIENQYAKQLPFVVYSRPINSVIKCWLQEDDTLHNAKNFKESGFVFAPFNIEEKSVLFPKANCTYLEIECSDIETKTM